jgi:hypothetical protein
MRPYFVLIAYNTIAKTKFKMYIIWIKLIILIFFIICSGDMSVDVDHLHINKIHLVHLVGFYYIVIQDAPSTNQLVY